MHARKISTSGSALSMSRRKLVSSPTTASRLRPRMVRNEPAMQADHDVALQPNLFRRDRLDLLSQDRRRLQEADDILKRD
jgi:hypothetical protein